MKENLKNQLRRSIIEDTLSAAGAPVSTVQTVFKAVSPRWFWPNYFLQWDSGFSLEFYTNHTTDVISFPLHRRRIVLPVVMEISTQARALAVDEIIVESSAELFELDHEVRGRTDQIFKYFRRFLRLRGKKYHNGQLLRLSRIDIKPDGKLHLFVNPVRYEAVCRTNLCLDSEERPVAETLRQYIHKDRKLCAIDNSRLANALGINFILLTADGRVVLPRRSGKVVVRPHELSPSFSGDCEWTDAPPPGEPFSLSHLLREAFEELNLLEQDVNEEESVQFLGLGRELIRGGKPELFFFAKTQLTKNDFIERHRDAPDRWEFRKAGAGWVFWDFGTEAVISELNEQQQHVFRANFENLMVAHGSEMSIPLQTNLCLWAASKLCGNWLGTGL